MSLLKIVGLLVLGFVVIAGFATALPGDRSVVLEQSSMPDLLEFDAAFAGDLSAVRAADVLWEGNVTLTEGETFTVTPKYYSSDISGSGTYTFDRMTGLGALDAVTGENEEVTYELADLSGTVERVVIYEVNGIQDEMVAENTYNYWHIRLNNEHIYKIRDFNQQKVKPGDTVHVMYCKLEFNQTTGKGLITKIFHDVIIHVKTENDTPLSADFTAIPTSGKKPLTVEFTDMSTGDPTAWAWDFGDGGASEEQNPAHNYTDIGNYTVSLTVSNAAGTDTEEKTNYITVDDGNGEEAHGNLTMSQGWNFISTPKYLAEGYNTAAIFSGVDTSGRSIYTYDPAAGFVPLGETDQVRPLDGIWVYANSTTTVPLTYNANPLQAPPTKALSAGWNAIGCTDSEEIAVADALISVREKWSHLIGFDAAAQSYEAAILSGGTGTLTPTRGYWVFMTDEGTLAAVSA